MVSNYKRKTNQGSWSEENLNMAIYECKNGTKISTAANLYNIPFSTLYRRLKSGRNDKQLGRFRPIFSITHEKELVEYLKEMDAVFYGLTRYDFKNLVYSYAKLNNIQYPNSWDKNKSAGNDWLVCFLKRNPSIVLRTPEPTSVARARGFNRPQVERFFSLLDEQYQKYNIDATRVYNMDETGISTTTNKPPKILSVCGKKQVGVISSAERGKLTTVICCCNAAGSFIPPCFIFARERMQERLLDNAPPGSKGYCSSSGWTNGDIFLIWLKFFVEVVRPTPDKKIILVLDNHESHKYYPALKYATDNNIIFVSFAPHTTHKIQPLDVSVFGPIKQFYEQEINIFQKNYSGRIINQYDVAKIFSPAYLKGATPHNAVSGFKRTGIWPFNPRIFGDEEFAPASVTDRPLENSVVTPTSEVNKVPSPKANNLESDLVHTLDTYQLETMVATTSSTPQQPIKNCTKVSPTDIRPIPKIDVMKMSTRKRKTQRAEVLTTTPVKNIQLEKMKNAERKIINTVAKRPTRKSVRKSLNFESTKKKASEDSTQYFCPICSEKYVCGPGGKPFENWIQCYICEKWYHEDCTSYLGKGHFVCDFCEDTNDSS